MARQLVELSGGSLQTLPSEDARCPFAVKFILPTAEERAVLVIDDNADTLQLFQRYLEGSRYLFIGTSDPEQALSLAEELAPQVIVLDVMLPGIDGWELLGRLRAHPAIGDKAIIVCTILPQERLALTLGAAAFLRKPVSRSALLSALDHQTHLAAQGSC
jgi:CheY-like chemotaxis protein